MVGNRSVDFFEAQFRREAAGGDDPALNPFEEAVLPWLSGRVADLGCGMGHLALAAASRGCDVVAVDASPAGIGHLAERARAGGASVEARLADARDFRAEGAFDAVVSIGLLMFVDCGTARALLARWQSWVRPGGIMAVNVLVAGTTFLEMFDPASHCLWTPGELDAAFAGWIPLHAATEDFPAPGGTLKRFRTLIARKSPGAADLR